MSDKLPLTPEILAASYFEPEFFFREVLGFKHLAGDYVIDIANSVRDNRVTRVQAGRGVAKSHTLGCLAAWWFTVLPGSAVFLTGGVYRQVKNAYAECKKAMRNSPYALPGRVLDTEVKSDSDEHWRIVSFAAKNADAALGGHAEHVLVLADEASGMDPGIAVALEGCLAGPHDRIVWSGNPLHTSGYFAELAHKPHVHNISISCKSTINYLRGENLIRGVATREFVEQMAMSHGEDSDIYRVHVLGLMPREGGNSIFSISSIHDAKVRGENWRAPTDEDDVAADVAGLDLARLGSDKCALLTISAGAVSEVDSWGGRTLDYTMDRARAWLHGHGNGRLYVDATSEGTFSDVLGREFGPDRVIGVNFGGAPVLGHTLPKPTIDAPSRPLYQNRRAEMWYEAAKWTRTVGLWSPDLPQDVADELERDLLSAIRVDPAPNGSMRVERKDAARKRLGRSPDLGDAYCLAVSGLLANTHVPRSSRIAVPQRAGPQVRDYERALAARGVRYRHRTGDMQPIGRIRR